MALETSTREFVESGKYAKLPTEAEKAEAEKELKEAKEEELHIKDPSEEEAAAEETEADEAGDRAGLSETDVKPADADRLKEAAAEAVKQRIKNISGERELTRMEAETTPEAMKVKRAKAQAAYKSAQIEAAPVKALDIRAD